MATERAGKRSIGPRPVPPPAPPNPNQPVLDQLDRILGSESFQQADRLKRFLAFIVKETLEGRGGDLKEYVIGVQVFRKEDMFDPRTDPIVRVQARRLRAKLMRYYDDEGRADVLTIELPKGGYSPIFHRRDAPASSRPSVAVALITRNSIVVLPFTNHSAESELDAFGKGIADEVVHRLTQLPGLRVVKGADDAAATAKGAAALMVSGSVRRASGRVRVNIHLLDAATGVYLWSEVVDGDLADGFAVQERVAEVVTHKLEPEAGVGALRVSRPGVNLAAQNLCIQGRYHLNQRTEEGLTKAVDFFEKALVEDSQSVLAHSGLADAYSLLSHYGVRGPADVWSKAASHAATAVLIDDGSAEAHTSVAHAKATQDWDWVGAERGFQRAITLNPRYATAHHWYAASCLAPLGRLTEALESIRTAQTLDPVSSIIARDLAMIHFYRRDFETALEQCDQTIELNPHFAPAYWMLGLIQEQRRDFDESAAAFQRAVHLSPRTPRMHGALGRTFALSGRRDQALSILQKLDSFARERYVSPLEFAWIHFALGDLDEGFRWLAKARDDRAFDLISLKVDPRFDPFRSDERFPPFLKRMGLD